MRTRHPRSVRRARLAAVLGGLLGATVLAAVSPGAGPSYADPAGTLHLPDLQTIIPTNSFSIVGTGQNREFRYTHLVYNGGPGPLQIQPFYRESAGVYLGHQQLLTHDEDGKFTVAQERRVADAFIFHAEHGHFHFPLASFGLYEVAPDGGIGAPASLSPKNGFCISDSYIYDTEIEHAGAGQGSWGTCTDPTTLRGISVGGADEYDYRDPGQAVPIPGLPDGTYWFRAMTDPNNDILESDESNNEEDVKVTIRNGEVSAGATASPDTTPCTTALQNPSAATLSGTVSLQATTSAAQPVRVQYYVDGLLTATSDTDASPYPATWNTTGTVDGMHWVSSKVTASRGRVCTSRPIQVTVDNSAGPDSTGPLLSFTDPEPGSTVGGRVAIAVNAADTSGVAKVRFSVGGTTIGADKAPPFTLVWNSRQADSGWHRVSAEATDAVGNSSRRTMRIKVVDVPPPLPLAVDGSVVARGTGTLVTPGLTTTRARDVVVALVSYDGPATPGSQSATVSGAGLSWHLVKRSTSQPGDSEIWAARTDGALHDRAIKAVPAAGGFDGMLSVFAFRNAARVSVAAAAGATGSAPSFYLPAIQEGSWVFAAANNWDHAVAPVPVAGQVIRNQWVNAGSDDTFWVQALARPTTAQRLVTIADTVPTGDRWNYVGVEVVARR
jgi:hypothetical protein